MVRKESTLLAFVLAQRHNQLVRGAVMSVVLMGLGTGVGYVIQIFISRTLGAQDYGTYSYVLGLLNVARTIVTVSFDMAALRFVSVYHSAEDWGRFSGFLWASRGTVGLLSAIGALLCIVTSFVFKNRLTPDLLEPLVAGCLLLAPASLLSLEVALLQALRRVYEARIPNVFLRPMVLAAALYICIAWLGRSPSATLALYANLVGVVAALVVSFWLMQCLVPQAARRASAVLQRREWFFFCTVNLGQNVVYLLLSQQADIVIVGSLIGTKDAGLYAAASQISALIVLGVSAVNQFAAPVLAEFHSRRTDDRLKQLLGRVMLLNAALSLPLIFVVVALGPMLLRMFGSAFVPAYPVIVVLAAGNFINALWGGLWGDLLTMTGFQNESAGIVIAVTILNLVLTIVLTPRIGTIGAAVGTTAAVLVRGVLVAVVVRLRLGIYPWTVLRHAMA